MVEPLQQMYGLNNKHCSYLPSLSPQYLNNVVLHGETVNRWMYVVLHGETVNRWMYVVLHSETVNRWMVN